MAYAEGTEVSVERSRQEIERLLDKHGIKERGVILGTAEAHVFFQKATGVSSRRVLFRLPMPDEKWRPQNHYRRRRNLNDLREDEVRRRWRALGLVLKAKLESVASGIEVFEDAFLAQIVLPSGRTVADEVRAPIAEAYRTNTNARLLPAWTPPEER